MDNTYTYSKCLDIAKQVCGESKECYEQTSSYCCYVKCTVASKPDKINCMKACNELIKKNTHLY
jgi:hypothetical protein